MKTIKIDQQGIIEQIENSIDDYEISIEDIERLKDDVGDKQIKEHLEYLLNDLNNEKETMENRLKEMENK